MSEYGVASSGYRVLPYSKENLVALFLAGAFHARDEYVRRKPQLAYLHDYCLQSKTKSLVYEEQYVDRHFSEDYGGYYVRCFGQYPKRCSRIHLFSSALDKRAFDRILGTKPDSDLSFVSREHYQGFIVVKPLPETVVGRSCLAPPLSQSNGVYPTLTPQRANLFGIDLSLSSLPFQEQDHEVAACATSALWSVLHGTARLFEHAVLSPLEITRIALSTLPLFGRALPNDGLDIYQMAGVVRHVGLEADVIDATERYLLQACAYAYLRGKVPVLLGIDFNFDRNKRPELHAVALTGYRIGASKPKPTLQTKFRLSATKIDRLYAHDDGVGPFSPIDFGPNNQIVTSWKDSKGQRAKAQPGQLLIPLYPQIRTPFLSIFEAILWFDYLIELLRLHRGLPLTSRLEWDIFLIEVANLKREVIADPSIAPEPKRRLLTKSLPKFLWRAAGSVAGVRKFDFLFDATDLLQGRKLVESIPYDRALGKALATELNRVDYSSSVQNQLSKTLIQHCQTAI